MKSNIYQRLAKRLKDFREDENLTQQQVADILHISRVAYGRYELGTRIPDLETLERIAQFYKIRIGDLLED